MGNPYCFKASIGLSLLSLKVIKTLEAIDTNKESKNIYNNDIGLNI